MGTIIIIHRWFGGLILPMLLLAAAIWFTVAWKRESWPGRPAQTFRVLVDIQFLLGLSFWLYMIASGAGARYLAFPFIFHPLMGLVAATVANLAARRNDRVAGLGRWAPLASLGLLFVMVLIAGTVARLVS
jgi:hypothetical protein